MKKLIFLLALLSTAAHGQSVRQSNNVTPGHTAVWITNGVIGDGGAVTGPSIVGSATQNDFVCFNGSGSLIDCGLSASGTNAWTGLQNLNGGATAPTRANADATTNVATTQFVQNSLAASIVATQYFFLIGNASNIAVPTALAGDCIYGASGIICTKTNNVAFVASATTDTTNAANISSGTLPGARLPALTGDVTSTVNTVATTITAGAVTGAKIATNTVGLTNLFQPGSNTTLCNPTGSTANWQACTPGQMSANLCTPSIQVFTSGTSLTYTVPTCNSVLASYLEIEMVGGGGGGAGTGTSGGNGTTGNASIFVFNAVTYTAGGGVNGTNGSLQAGGAGGTVTGCDDNIVGGTAGFGYGGSATTAFGVYGAGSVYGGAGGSGDVSNPGNNGATNTGGGGGVGGTGGAVVGGSPGGSGGFCRKLIAVGAVTTGTYTVGGAANGGGGGTNGQSGGNGAAGRLKVTARWQ